MCVENPFEVLQHGGMMDVPPHPTYPSVLARRRVRRRHAMPCLARALTAQVSCFGVQTEAEIPALFPRNDRSGLYPPSLSMSFSSFSHCLSLAVSLVSLSLSLSLVSLSLFFFSLCVSVCLSIFLCLPLAVSLKHALTRTDKARRAR